MVAPGYWKQRREAYLAKGICPRCKKRKVTPGRKSCEECLIRERGYARYSGKQVAREPVDKAAIIAEFEAQFVRPLLVVSLDRGVVMDRLGVG